MFRILFSILFILSCSDVWGQEPASLIANLPPVVKGLRPVLVSPSGNYAIASGFLGKKPATFYVGLLRPKVSLLSVPAYQKIFVTNDNRHLFGLVMDDDVSSEISRIEMVELGPSGKIVSRTTVWSKKASRSELCFGCTFLTKKGHLLFVEMLEGGAGNRFSAFDSRTKKRRVLLEQKTIYPLLSSLPYRAEPYAGENDWLAVYVAPCAFDISCEIGSVYGLNVNALKFRKLNIPDHGSAGRLNTTVVDEHSNSPWLGVIRCASDFGSYYSVYNVETDEQKFVHADADAKGCSSHPEINFSAAGDRIYWSDWLPLRPRGEMAGLFDLRQGKFYPTTLMAFAPSGNSGIILNDAGIYLRRDFPSGLESVAFTAPEAANKVPFNERRRFIDWFNIGGGSVWFTNAPAATGNGLFKMGIWKSTVGVAETARLVGKVIGEAASASEFRPCILTRFSDGMLCLSETSTGSATALKIWRF